MYEVHFIMYSFVLVLMFKLRSDNLSINDKKLIRLWDSERELFYDDIRHVLQSTIDLRMAQS